MNPPRPLALWSATCADPGDVLEVRRVHARIGARSTWHRAQDLPDLVEQLMRENQHGWNIYAGVNPRLGDGRRTDDGVALARIVCADFDNVSVDDTLARWRAAGLPAPSLVISSGHGCHVYLRLTFSIRDLKAWREFQKDLAALLGSDPTVHNPERIFRLPGFRNHKPPAADCFIVHCDINARHDFAALRAAVPHPVRKLIFKPRPVSASHRAGDPMKRCLAYLAKCPESVSGQRGHDKALRAACEGFRFGLSDEEVREVMRWWGEHKSGGEPWNEEEIEHKLESARRKTAGSVGSRLVARASDDFADLKAKRPQPFTLQEQEVSA